MFDFAPGLWSYQARAPLVGGSALWTPASLGANLALDLTELDSSHMFQDTACTTPVTADGQTVKGLKDTTTGIIFTNSTGWVYHANSGKPYLAMDGTSIFTSTTSVTFADANGQYSAWVTAALTNNGNNAILSGASGFGNLMLVNPATNANNVFVRNSSGTQLAGAWSKPVTLSTAAVFSGVATGSAGSGTVEAFVNNVDTPGSNVQSWTGTPAISCTLVIGSSSAGSFFGALLEKSAADTATKSNANTYMGALHP